METGKALEVIVYKSTTCVTCKPYTAKLDALGIEYDPQTIVMVDREPDDSSKPIVEHVKATLGHLGTPVTELRINDELRNLLTDDPKTITSNEHAQDIVKALKENGHASWQGPSLDAVSVIMHVRSLAALQPV